MHLCLLYYLHIMKTQTLDPIQTHRRYSYPEACGCRIYNVQVRDCKEALESYTQINCTAMLLERKSPLLQKDIIPLTLLALTFDFFDQNHGRFESKLWDQVKNCCSDLLIWKACRATFGESIFKSIYVAKTVFRGDVVHIFSSEEVGKNRPYCQLEWKCQTVQRKQAHQIRRFLWCIPLLQN
jgi:hypothetical protein